MEEDNSVFYKRLELFHNFFKRHWFWHLIIISFPTLWFSCFLPFFGIGFFLIDKDSKLLTPFGWISSIILGLIVIFYVFFYNLHLRHNDNALLKKKDGEIQYLSIITESVDNICGEKLSVLKRKIVEEKTSSKDRADIISNPSNQLKRIVDGIRGCLVKLLNSRENNLKYRDFLITIIYRFPQEDDKNWKWLDGVGESEKELNSLLNNDCNSTFNYLLKTNKPYYFNNSKEDAKSKNCYEYTPLDQELFDSNDPVGSIFCYRYSVSQTDVTYVDTIISITTNKKRFTNESYESCKNVKENMISLVKDKFGIRIGIELSLLYLEYLKAIEKDIN